MGESIKRSTLSKITVLPLTLHLIVHLGSKLVQFGGTTCTTCLRKQFQNLHFGAFYPQKCEFSLKIVTSGTLMYPFSVHTYLLDEWANVDENWFYSKCKDQSSMFQTKFRNFMCYHTNKMICLKWTFCHVRNCHVRNSLTFSEGPLTGSVWKWRFTFCAK